jgi:hypothetical protein
VASSTGLPRSNGGVWEVADVEESRWVKGGVMERSAATGNVDVLARSGARPCTLWRARACLGAFVPACVVHQCVEHRVWHVQEGEGKGQDMVVHAEVDQRGGWHGCVSCMPWHGWFVMILCMAACLWCLS